MKILELRFKNLNSLYGEWLIDFTDPEYVSHGIFALTGPTGAGKSTILDAICLALYGATPRLGKITKKGNEIMSRQTGECYAEVLFETRSGHFRCHWEQRRARKRASGNLQDQEHQIVDSRTGKPIETKKSLVCGIVEEKTGMDFDRFTRSILLAQGGFDTFLRADIEQKSKILEQITGTGIYSEISRCVHERHREEREKLNLIQAETSGIIILDPNQEKELQGDLKANLVQEAELSSKSSKTEKAIAWLTSITELEKEISNLSEEAHVLQTNLEAFKPQRLKLEKAKKAATLDGVHATLTAIKKQQSEDRSTLNSKQEMLPELVALAQVQVELLKSNEQQTVKAKEQLISEAPLIQKIRALDQKLKEQEKTVFLSEEKIKQDSTKIENDKKAQLKEQEKRVESEETPKLSNHHLSVHAQDEWLISGLAGIEEQFNNLLAKQKEIAQKEKEHKAACKALEQATQKLASSAKQCDIDRQKLQVTSENLQKGRDQLSHLLGDHLLREYRTQKETQLREMAFLSKIAELVDHRKKLQDQKPCPLCGAIEHPFAEGNVPVPDETEKKIKTLTTLITKAEGLETANKTLEKAETKAHRKLMDHEKSEITADNTKKTAEKTLADLADNLEFLRKGFFELKQAVSIKLNPLGIEEIPQEQVSSVLKSLKTRLNSWQDQVKRKASIEAKITEIDSEVKRLTAVIETQNTALDEKQKSLSLLKNEYRAGLHDRKTLYGNKKPDEEENNLNHCITRAEGAEKKARNLNTNQQQKLATAKTHVESLKKGIEQREPELQKARVLFLSELQAAGFIDEQQFIEARLTNKELDALSIRAGQLDNGQTELEARQQDRGRRLAKEKARKVTEQSLEDLMPIFQDIEATLKELRNLIATLRHKLDENAVAKERIKDKQSAIDAQKTECLRWDNLHALIGSSDGKKFRNFAQGLTFELMVSHANRQLVKMTDRYLLIRDVAAPLELNVIDNFQAGEIRSTRNLSGGESFIVSLTLALGLSNMASRKVRVDSLFLDEGFGTLDEESLDTALETLSGLQREDKLIGIISHVPALKERISTQITISPVSGGRSSVIGPGCNRLFGHAKND